MLSRGGGDRVGRWVGSLAERGVAMTAPVGMARGIMSVLLGGIVWTSTRGEGGRLSMSLRRRLLRHVGELGRVGYILGVVVVMVIRLKLVADGRVNGRLALLCLCDWILPLDPCLSCGIKVHGLGWALLLFRRGKASF